MTKNVTIMFKKIRFYILVFFCLILNIIIDTNLNNYLKVLEIVFNRKISITLNLYSLICFIFACISILILLDIMLVIKKEKTKNKGVNFKIEDGTYGTAKWMSEVDMKNILTLEDEPGIILGKYNSNIVKLPLKSYFNKNICVFGSSGSMKTIRFSSC